MNQLATRDRQRALTMLLLLTALSATVLGATACANIRLISDYDPIVDEAVTALQKDVDTFLTRLDDEVAPTVEEAQEIFDQLHVDLRAIQVRASAQTKNELIIQQLDLVADNLGLLTEAYGEGIEDPQEIELFRNSFQTQFRAILKLELAKRRGE